MNIIVRFYWQHDLDLVALALHPDFDLNHWMKFAVIAAARGDTGFYIPIPRPQPYQIELNDCSVHFSLNEKKEKDVIEFLKGFRYGFRNSAIKLILRQYLATPFIEPFFNEQMYHVKARGRGNGRNSSIQTPNLISKNQKEHNIMNGNYPVDVLKQTVRPTNVDFSQANTYSNVQGTTCKDFSELPQSNSESKISDMQTKVVEQNKEFIPATTPLSSNIDSQKQMCDMEKNENDLGKEETETMEGNTFDLFSTIGKMISDGNRRE